ncbi:myeloid-derived growth factor [Brachionichthys hirsutus]|uniref:myeloid-derived growth factor n=1 Tax=Brachionichthys hirsutus TaxID=412623 RepID=UPI003605299B
MASQINLCAVHAAILVMFMLIAAFVPVDASSKTVPFNIKPGGTVNTFTESIEQYVCSFTSASQGGTNEEWMMSLGLSDDEMFSCTLWRPQGVSYLLFNQFKVELKGAKIKYANGYSQTAPAGQDVLLKQDELIIGDSVVTHAEGKFRSQLSKLTVVGLVKHDEL